MKTKLSIAFFSSSRILSHYYSKGLIDEKELEKYIFVQSHENDPSKPDYIYKEPLKEFVKDKTLSVLLLNWLDELSQMLEFQGEHIYVKKECFDRWQDAIVSVSPVLVISYAIYKKSLDSFRNDAGEIIAKVLEKSTLPSIHEPHIEHLVEQYGLNEMHMHLNGTTETDVVWQDALLKPREFYSYIAKSLSKSDAKEISEQYLQLGDFEQGDFYRLLRLAAGLRDDMLSVLYGIGGSWFDIPTRWSFDFGRQLDHIFGNNHPIKQLENTTLKTRTQCEALFFVKCFEYMATGKSARFASAFHYYVLIFAFFQKMLVQQKTQVGFDQFQKITVNELRELTEKEYEKRFYQLMGMYDNDLSVLEGRFAPKDNYADMIKLLKPIKKGYTNQVKEKYKLLLVPHFVKEKDKLFITEENGREPKDLLTFRDASLRVKNRKRLEALLSCMKHKEFKGLIVGFDAAANELHARPEAFAPVFRKLGFLGYKNFTYHAGEDYIHLLSGMRTIYEAVEFLEMRSGNRIGHGTAIGIEPELWLERLNGCSLGMSRGEWLDNLIFVYDLLLCNREEYAVLARIENDIRRHFVKIYGNKFYSMHQIITAWKLRKHDPFIAFEWKEPSIFDGFEQGELQYLENMKLADKNAFDLFEMYHTGEYIEKYREHITIKPDELNTIFDADMLRKLQNAMIDLLNKKNIAIESLPTSNVRISYYEKYDEHHIQRWLGLNNKSEKDHKPTVVLGSDDTGIFATNLRNEYAHVFQILERNHGRDVAIEQIERLQTNSKVYTFKS